MLAKAKKYQTYWAFMLLLIGTTFTYGCEMIQTTLPMDGVSVKTAVATISGLDENSITGTATFMEMEGAIHAVIEVQNASPGLHAMHLHTGTSCLDVGLHWHPVGIPAGTVGVPVAEATQANPPIGRGEIGNVLVGETGTGRLEFTTPLWSLGGSPDTDILGKLILVHEVGDTFEAMPHGQHLPDNTSMVEMGATEHHHHDAGTPPHSHDEMPLSAQGMEMPDKQPGGGAKIGCGLIELVE